MRRFEQAAKWVMPIAATVCCSVLVIFFLFQLFIRGAEARMILNGRVPALEKRILAIEGRAQELVARNAELQKENEKLKTDADIIREAYRIPTPAPDTFTTTGSKEIVGGITLAGDFAPACETDVFTARLRFALIVPMRRGHVEQFGSTLEAHKRLQERVDSFSRALDFWWDEITQPLCDAAQPTTPQQQPKESPYDSMPPPRKAGVGIL